MELITWSSNWLHYISLPYFFFLISSQICFMKLFTHRVQNGSGAHSSSYIMGARGCFPGSKEAGA
jgi:hypothetical protein